MLHRDSLRIEVTYLPSESCFFLWIRREKGNFRLLLHNQLIPRGTRKLENLICGVIGNCHLPCQHASPKGYLLSYNPR